MKIYFLDTHVAHLGASSESLTTNNNTERVLRALQVCCFYT